jgi:hypothetical protein
MKVLLYSVNLCFGLIYSSIFQGKKVLASKGGFWFCYQVKRTENLSVRAPG